MANRAAGRERLLLIRLWWFWKEVLEMAGVILWRDDAVLSRRIGVEESDLDEAGRGELSSVQGVGRTVTMREVVSRRGMRRECGDL